ncbi:MAG: DNA polymerase domain-containing protein [Candidatus Woesearchaeota archaeon]
MSHNGFIISPSSITIGEGEEEKTVIQLYGRLETGDSFVALFDYKPYFYIKETDLKKAEKIVKCDITNTTFHNFDNEKVVKLAYTTPKALNEARKALYDAEIACYESDVQAPMQFLIEHELKGSIRLEGKSYGTKEYNSMYKTAYRVDHVFHSPRVTGHEHYPELKILSIDIETDMKHSQLYSIALYMTHGTKIQEKVLIAKKGGFVKGEGFSTEKELLERFVQLVREWDPDVITGWHVIDFDLQVIKDKCKEHSVDFTIGRDNTAVYIKLSDSFYQDSIAKISGRVVLDGISLLKNSFVRLPDFKLETAAQHYLSEGKLFTGDARHEDIERSFHDNPQKLIDYNLIDAKLVIDILRESKVLDLTIVRSKLTRMPLDRVKASIASFDSLYLQRLHAQGVVAPTAFSGNREERIQGGYVRESQPGIYDNMLVFDFKSLYPSIIRTFNIDPYSFIPSEKIQKYSEKEQSEFIKAPNGAHFKHEEGFLPAIIQDLWKARDNAKKENNPLKSQAIKILMNSFFGVMANPTFRFYSIEMANAITHFGQHLIKKAAEFVEKKGLEVTYGDSVSADTKIIVMDTKHTIKEVPIHTLYTQTDRKNNAEKEYCLRTPYKVLTIDKEGKSVFKNITYIMRHKAQKKVFRVHITNAWYIDVTDDHSLIGYVNKQKKPYLEDMERLVESTPSDFAKKNIHSLVTLSKIPQKKTISKKYPVCVYEFMGLFIGDGSFDRQLKPNYYLHLSTGIDTSEIVHKVLKPLQKENYIKNYWLKSKGDICLNGNIVRLFNEKLRNNGKKKIPVFLLQETEDAICAFLRGVFSADGTIMIRNDSAIIRFTNTNYTFIETILYLLHTVGISSSFFKENSYNKYKKKQSKTFSYHINIKDKATFSKKVGFLLDRKNERLKKISKAGTHRRTIDKYEFDISSIQKVEKIDYQGYVYDIEVDDTHRFFANNILVHNTDSVFINPKESDYEKAVQTGNKLCEEINEFMKSYISKNYRRESMMELEFEKTYKRFFMPRVRGSEAGAKKRYAGLLDKNGKEVLDFVGLEFVRSDWTQLAKDFQEELLHTVFARKKVEPFIRQFVKDMQAGKYDHKLVYRKQIRKRVSEYTKTTPPHIQAARKIGRDDVGIIDYVMTTDGPEEKEHVSHDIDYTHYLDKQIKPIADSVLDFFDTTFDDILKPDKQHSLLGY